jgi:hypothetical protein
MNNNHAIGTYEIHIKVDNSIKLITYKRVPTCNNTDLISSQFEDGTVTHSFANRKRSVVKRRQSVLSHSFTAESEAEAIKMERESALAALENRLKKEQRESVGEIDKRKSLRRSTSLTLPTNTEFGYPGNTQIIVYKRKRWQYQ